MRLVLLLFFCLYLQVAQAGINRLRCIIREDPSTHMTIAWNQVNGQNPILYYGIQDEGTNADAYPLQAVVSKTTQAKGMLNCFVRLENLKPNTVYYFVIRDSKHLGKRYHFKTLSDKPDARLSIIAGGDSRSNRQARQQANILVSKLRPDFVLFGGDMTSIDNTAQWREWLDDWQLTTAADGRMTPIVPARGNHEFSNASIVELFDAPHPSIYYAFTVGGDLLRVYTLNSLIPVGGQQAEWLEQDLAAHTRETWRMVQYHYPTRPHTARKHERNDQRMFWCPLFEKYKVKLAIECDAHLLKYTWPIKASSAAGSDEGFIRDDKNGVTYIGEGGWGAPLRPTDDDKTWTRNSTSENHVHWIFVDKQGMEIRSVFTNNAQEIKALSDTNRFEIATNVKVWSPSNGAVIQLIP